MLYQQLKYLLRCQVLMRVDCDGRVADAERAADVGVEARHAGQLVEPADRPDNSDLVFGRDYSEQYEAPIRRDGALQGCINFAAFIAEF
jgi:hypothetical protein